MTYNWLIAGGRYRFNFSLQILAITRLMDGIRDYAPNDEQLLFRNSDCRKFGIVRDEQHGISGSIIAVFLERKFTIYTCGHYVAFAGIK